MNSAICKVAMLWLIEYLGHYLRGLLGNFVIDWGLRLFNFDIVREHGISYYVIHIYYFFGSKKLVLQRNGYWRKIFPKMKILKTTLWYLWSMLRRQSSMEIK